MNLKVFSTFKSCTRKPTEVNAYEKQTTLKSLKGNAVYATVEDRLKTSTGKDLQGGRLWLKKGRIFH